MTRRILLDCDGVLADFVRPAADWARLNGAPTACVTNCDKWDVLESWGIAHKQAKFDRHCSRKGYGLALPVYIGAQTFVRELRTLGEVVIVTSPYSAAPLWCFERVQWLADHFGFQSKDVIFSKRKDLIRGDVLIDDGPQNLQHFAGWRVLVDRPWNQDADARGFDWRCRTYSQILDAVSGV